MKQKNKLTTLSYFVKRLKDSGFITWKICDNYSQADARKWTIMIDPGNTSVFVTCYKNRDFREEVFEFTDGGQYFPRNFSIKTASMEVIVTSLIQKGVQQVPSS
jgi:hypothetical protein